MLDEPVSVIRPVTVSVPPVTLRLPLLLMAFVAPTFSVLAPDEVIVPNW